MTAPKDRPIDSELVLQRGKESLWYQLDKDGQRIRYMTMDCNSNLDYPLLVRSAGGEVRVLYDYPERLSSAFKRMVRMEMSKS